MSRRLLPMSRRLLPALLTVTAAVALAGCSSSASAGWTFEPAPSVTPAPSVSASESAGASTGGSAPAGATGAPASGASGSPAASGQGGASVQLAAQNIQFSQTDLTAPADSAFTIAFNNMDQGVPHNVAIKDASGTEVFKGDIITGPATANYQVPALKAGTYTFYCSVHPNMTGTLTVK